LTDISAPQILVSHLCT